MRGESVDEVLPGGGRLAADVSSRLSELQDGDGEEKGEGEGDDPSKPVDLAGLAPVGRRRGRHRCSA